ncbi:hypothetical protein ACFFMM_30950 [Micromonospora chaiyaphumensis]|uniref:Uncharacterized protein n=1 Tax=Micromonospora chaiyaphumensis TaxID=307119 RepID=A0A1C4X1S2_9ACTN|nr:hypothetical protein [Micromonospora chaiyaphumensis]SCF02437.1 hypothetical protein GA0070214_10523 [Micromonospora chaiyaphumensis]
MTEEHVDRLVRDADPYRPEVIRHLDGAEQALLEEIMSEPTPDRVADAPRRSRTRRGLVRRLAGPLTAAAALIGVLAVVTVYGEPPGDRRAAPTETVAPTSAGPTTSIVFSPVALKAAEENPRLLIDEPGWQVTTVYGFAEKQGTIAFRNGGQQMDMNWYPADQYAGYHADRRNVSAPEAVKVDGWSGDLFRYSAEDFAVLLRPRDGVFVELRAGGGNRTEFDRLLTHVVRVDVRTWLAALPPEIVTPARVDEQAAKVLADIPLPPDFDRAALAGLGTNDAYQFGAQVTSRVGCAWIAEWQRAKRAGDDAALRRAADALRSSHKWQVLHQMNDEGDWPEVFWETADKVAAGDLPRGYDQALGCA